jgi:hypothetical protein
MTDATATDLIQRLVEDLESWMEHLDCLPESDLLTEARLYLSLQELAKGEVKPIEKLFAKADEESREVDEHGYPLKLGDFYVS